MYLKVNRTELRINHNKPKKTQWTSDLLEKLTVPHSVREVTLGYLCLGLKGDIE